MIQPLTDLSAVVEQTGGPDSPERLLVGMEGISKRFPGVVANDGVDFSLRAGEVHALLGENGAGKTTLMNILFGLYHPDQGRMTVHGQPVVFHSPSESIARGIFMVHQTFRLIPTLTVAENVLLGLSHRRGIFNQKETARRLADLSDQYRLGIAPDRPVWQLAAGEQQRVAILKALYRDVKILILDEPTSVLTPFEAEGLFAFIQQLAREGSGVVFISHKLEEVLQVSHRITVLRDGQRVAEVPRSQVDQAELARLMVGREVLFRLEKAEQRAADEMLTVEDLTVRSDSGLLAVKGLSLEVRRGEILGIAGVAGNGQTELAEALFGLRPAASGRVALTGADVTGFRPRNLIERGVAFIPDQVRDAAVFASFSIEDNTALKMLDRPGFRTGLWINDKATAAWAEGLMQAFDVRAPSRHMAAGKLSGGNLQKMVLGCELARCPELIIVVNPTAGLDVRATEYIRGRLLEERQRGTAILLISSDLDEVINLSDRIAVMYGGSFAGQLTTAQATPETLGLLMAGMRPATAAGPSNIVASDQGRALPGAARPGREDLLNVALQRGEASVRRPDLRQWLHLLADRSAWVSLLSLTAAIALALLAVGALISTMGVSPLDAYQALGSALRTRNGAGETLVRATPLILAGLSVTWAFRAGVWNIGAEGQLIMGALGALVVGLVTDRLPALIHLPLAVAGGFAAGALYGALPGLMKALRGANEIITTIMLNFVAVFILSFFITGPLRDPEAPIRQARSLPVAEAVRLPVILDGSRGHAGIFIALLAAVVVFLWLWKTVSGYRLRAVGVNPKAARFGGVNVPLTLVLAIAVSGGLAGIGGMVELAGVRGYLLDNFSGGVGYTSIAVALLGGLHPAGVVLAAVFIAALEAGAEILQITTGVPSATVLVIEGLALVFVLSRRLVARQVVKD